MRQVEARYVGKLAFHLVARHGRIADEQQSFEMGHSWEELDRLGFKLRLSELERGAVNVVVQPGQWELPRVDHLGVALDDDEFDEVIDRATRLKLRIQAHGGRRTFVSLNAGYRLEVHPPCEWLDELLERRDELTLGELLDVPFDGGTVMVGATTVRFLPGGPAGRPQLHAELFV